MIPLILIAVFIGLASRGAGRRDRGPLADAVCEVLMSPEVMNPGFGLMEAVTPIAYPDAPWPQANRWTTDDIAELAEAEQLVLNEARAQVQRLLRSPQFLKQCAWARSSYAEANVRPASPAGFTVHVKYNPRVEVLKDGKRTRAKPDKGGPVPDVGAAIRVAELMAYRLGTPPEEDATFDRGVIFDDEESRWDGISGWTLADGTYVTKLWSLAPMSTRRTDWADPSGFDTALAAAMEID